MSNLLLLFRGAAESAGGFSPLSIATLFAWYDASDTSTITESSSLVSQLDDKSGNAYHLAQATAANQFTTGASTVNGLNVLTNSQLTENMANTASGWNTTAFTAFIVGSTSNTDFIKTGFFSCNTTYPRHQLYYNSGASLSYVADFHGTTDAIYPLAKNTNVHVLCVRATTSGDLYLYRNGVLAATGNWTYGSQTGIIMGCTGSSNVPLNKFCELIIYSSDIADSDRGDATSYLMAKWGVS